MTLTFDASPGVDDGAATVSIRANRHFGPGKRLFDILLCLVILPVVALVTTVLWALVRADGGPGFFCQTRVGRGGRPFRCWKLRSMAVDAETRLTQLCAHDPALAREWHNRQKLENDPRVTRIGAFLRRTSLDELPQIWNILRGDMSLVGPRPFMPSQERLYAEAGGRAYFLIRPGVTGPWQVDGRSTTRFVDRVRFDEGYYASASALTDLALLIRTAGVVVRMTGR